MAREPGGPQPIPILSIASIAWVSNSLKVCRLLRNSPGLFCAIDPDASSKRAVTACSAKSEWRSGWGAVALLKPPMNLWTDWFTSRALTWRRISRQWPGFASLIACLKSAPANARLAKNANAANGVRFRTLAVPSYESAASPTTVCAIKTTPETKTAAIPATKMGNTRDCRTYSSYILSSASLLELIPCMTKTVTANVRAAIAAWAPSKAPRSVSTSLVLGSQPMGSVTRSHMRSIVGPTASTARRIEFLACVRLG